MLSEATCARRESRGLMTRVSFQRLEILGSDTAAWLSNCAPKNAQTTKVTTFGPGAVWSLAPVCFLQLYLNLLRLQFYNGWLAAPNQEVRL